MKADIIALGEILIDFTPKGKANNKTTYQQNAGGAPANVLSAITRLGLKTSFIGCVGNDFFGKYLVDFLHQSHIDTTYLKVSEKHNTTLAFVHLDKKGDRSFSFYRNGTADYMIEDTDIVENIFSEIKLFHFGSLSLSLEPAKTATVKALQLARKKGCIISYDPNLRPLLWPGPAEAKKAILSVMDYVNVLKVSEEELQFLTEEADIKKGSKHLYEKYHTGLIIITSGEQGCVLKRGNDVAHIPAAEVKAVDTTGAGDAHMGAMLYHLVSQGSYDEVSFEKLITYAEFANHMAGYVTTCYGSAEIMPGYNQVIESMQNL